MIFFSRQLRAHPAFREGMQAMLPQAPGLVAWGLMTGVAMVKSGMSTFEAVAMALLVFAGSSQLAAIPLIMAGAPAWVILATSFCVNLRFVVFSLHLRAYFMHMALPRRLLNGYVTADMSYVIFTRRFPQPASDAAGQLAQDAFLAGNCAVNWTGWMSASLLGIVLAYQIPPAWGLGFAGILCLLGVMCSLVNTRLRVVACAVAGAAAIAAFHLPLKLNIVTAIAVAVMACLALEQHPALRDGKPA